MPDFHRCLVCGHPVPRVTFTFASVEEFTCTLCGPYKADRVLAEDGIDRLAVPPEKRYLLQGWIRRHQIDERQPPLLSDLTCANAVRDAPRFNPTEKMEQLLLAYAARCKRPGGTWAPSLENDYPCAWAVDSAECNQYWEWLFGAKFLAAGASNNATLSRKGWERVGELRAAKPGDGNKVFVAMWFDDSMDDAWENGLAAGIKDVDYIPHRVKEEIHRDKIDARIIAGIRECRFLVADVSGARQAVYYEAGFAEGLGKNVIWTCRFEDKDSMCFDTRQYPHIIWNNPAYLREQLAYRIKALAL